ncbi:MAG TPA: prepilin-type N-terminal cleavage/methylation domain-containing protein [Vicinamibacteria bacterium]|jgi:prepilin-type N-terminal cleavage/methylation domain-containing protein
MTNHGHCGTKLDPKGREGFSLIEVMIAIVILTVGLLSLAQMMVVATNANALAGRMTASAALAKQQLELLKAAPFYTNPANPSIASMNALLAEGGDLDSNEAGYFQLYNADGEPVDPGTGSLFVVRWQIERLVDPKGDMPLAMLRITVRCLPSSESGIFLGVGEARFVTFRTANVG